MNADAIALLLAKGLSGEDILELARIMEASEPQRSSGAERQARYRARGGGKIPETMRQEVFERDGWACLDCGSDQYLCADHIIPVSKGGETSFDNLQTLCLPCNSRKKDRIRKRDVRRKEATLSGGMSGGKSTDNPLNEYISKTPPSETKVSSERVKRACKVDQFPCPAGVDRIDWQALLQNRKQKRAALSEGAHRQIIKKLNEWERDGWPPGPIVAHAAEMGWTSVFPTDEMKAKQNGRLPTPRNFRPEPAMALKRIAEAELAAEGASGHKEFGGGTRLALPDYLTN